MLILTKEEIKKIKIKTAMMSIKKVKIETGTRIKRMIKFKHMIIKIIIIMANLIKMLIYKVNLIQNQRLSQTIKLKIRIKPKKKTCIKMKLMRN